MAKAGDNAPWKIKVNVNPVDSGSQCLNCFQCAVALLSVLCSANLNKQYEACCFISAILPLQEKANCNSLEHSKVEIGCVEDMKLWGGR